MVQYANFAVSATALDFGAALNSNVTLWVASSSTNAIFRKNWIKTIPKCTIVTLILNA